MSQRGLSNFPISGKVTINLTVTHMCPKDPSLGGSGDGHPTGSKDL